MSLPKLPYSNIYVTSNKRTHLCKIDRILHILYRIYCIMIVCIMYYASFTSFTGSFELLVIQWF